MILFLSLFLILLLNNYLNNLSKVFKSMIIKEIRKVLYVVASTLTCVPFSRIEGASLAFCIARVAKWDKHIVHPIRCNKVSPNSVMFANTGTPHHTRYMVMSGHCLQQNSIRTRFNTGTGTSASNLLFARICHHKSLNRF